jgi:hypothetical protein
MSATQPAIFQHDQPQLTNDLYSRKPFAEQTARLLVLPPKSPGVVIGIEGAWGSGKTTVVHYIVESLKTATDEPPIVVEFTRLSKNLLHFVFMGMVVVTMTVSVAIPMAVSMVAAA